MKIFKYHSINIFLLHSLRNKKNWYSKLAYLNDPYDCFFIDKTNTTIYKQLISTFSVCCFSKNMDNILMWSHYADNHRGVCLEWEIDKNSEKLKGSLEEISYDDELITLDKVERTKDGYLSLNRYTNAKFLFQKLKTWKYEEELRLYKICEEPNLKGQTGDFLGELTAIYFGRNASQDDIELVKFNTSHIENLKYYKVELDDKSVKYNSLTSV